VIGRQVNGTGYSAGNGSRRFLAASVHTVEQIMKKNLEMRRPTGEIFSKRFPRWPFSFCVKSLVAVLLLALAGVFLAGKTEAQQSEAVKQFVYASKLLDDGLYDLAASQFRAFLEQYPDSPRAPEAMFLLGDCLMRSGEYAQANGAFQRLLAVFPDSPRADEAAFRIAENLYRLGKTESAIRSLERFPLFYPRSPFAPRALLRAGELAFANQDWARAEEDWRRVLEEYANSKVVPEARFHLAELYHRQRRERAAQAQIDQLLSAGSGPGFVKVALLKAAILTERYQLTDAEKIYRQLLKSGEQPGTVKLAYARFLAFRGQPQKGAEMLTGLLPAVKRAGLRDSVLAALAELQFQAGDDQACVQTAEQFYASGRDSLKLMATLAVAARAARRSEDYASATTMLTRWFNLEKKIGADSSLVQKNYLMMIECSRKAGNVARCGRRSSSPVPSQPAFSGSAQPASGNHLSGGLPAATQCSVLF